MYYNGFRKLGIECPMAQKGHKKVVCPECGGGSKREKSLSIYYDTGVYTCHRAKCGWKGNVKGFEKEYSRPVFNNNTNLPDHLVKYCALRGISQSTLLKLNITVDNRRNLQFNYFRNGELINIKTRIEKGDNKTFLQHKGAEKIFYNLDSIHGKKEVIITEGEFDVAAWVECGLLSKYGIISVDQGAGLPNSNLDNKLKCLENDAELLDKIEKFYIATDNDEPGVYLRNELIRRLGDYRCYIVEFPKGCKDANDVIDRRKQTADHLVNIQSLKLCLKNAKPVPVSGVHLLDDDISDLLLNYYDNGREKGTTTYMPDFDKNFTYLKGDITLFTGMPNDGKSQWVRHMMVLKSKFDGWKWACYVPEDYPIDVFYEDLCHILVGRTMDRDYSNRMTKEELIEAMKFIKEHFYCIYPEPDKKTGEIALPDNQWLNTRIRFLKLKYGINAYLKDPWNQIHHNITTREDIYLSQEISKEKFFASQFDAAIYVAHPAKQRLNKDGKYEPPKPYDLAGGAMFNNKFDNIITVFRPNRLDNPSDKVVEIHTWKIKKQKLVGRPGKLAMYFDIPKNRYYQFNTDYNALENRTPPPSMGGVLAIMKNENWENEPPPF